MLHLYSNVEDIPDGVKYVKDNVEFFMNVTYSKLDTRVDGLLSNTDGASYLNSSQFVDKYGVTVPWLNLSTGGMTVLNIFYNPDCCFDTMECGRNALTDLKNLKCGRAYPDYICNLDDMDDIDVIVDDWGDYHYTSLGGGGVTDRIVFKNNFIDFDISRTLSCYVSRSAVGKTYLPYFVRQFNGFPFVVNIATEDAYRKFLRDGWFAGDDAIYFFDRGDLLCNMEVIDIVRGRLDICCLFDLKSSDILNRSHVPHENVIINRLAADKFEVKNGILF